MVRVTCAPGIVPYLQAELEALGFEAQETDHTAVHIGATFDDCTRLNLELRTALRVLYLLKRFRCPSIKDLYKHVGSFPWEDVIPVDGYLTVDSRVDHPSINNSMFVNQRVKDAIVDRISSRQGARPDSGPGRDKLVINLTWKNDRCWVYLDTSGRRLADRGYRRIPMRAPMQETLAAAVLLATGYDGTQPLVNPMCGSGTIAIEAALMAAKRPPGLLRGNFSLMHCKAFDADAWAVMRSRLKKRSGGAMPPIIASDIDPKAIDAAQRNSTTAGVDHLIDFHTCDFAATPIPAEPGHIILNPAYGERLGEMNELREQYSAIGDFFKSRCAGWSGWIFTGNRDLAKTVGLRATRRIPFSNAEIDCRLFGYELYAGSRKRPTSEPTEGDGAPPPVETAPQGTDRSTLDQG